MQETSGRYRFVLLGLAVTVLGAVPAEAGGQARERRLPEAARRADTEAVRVLIGDGADVNARSGDGSTALLWASYKDDAASVDLLIRAGADVNLANDLGATPIWAASRNGSGAMAKKLLAAGADPNAPLLLGEMPLVTASRSGSADVVRMLLEGGADVNAPAARGQTPLMFAVAQRHPAVVQVLLEHGAEVDTVSDVWDQLMAQSPHAHPEHQIRVLRGGNTALMFAARVGDLESARHLVAAGARLGMPSAWGTTPLAIAAYSDFGEQFVIREETSRSLVYFDREHVLPGQFAELAAFLIEAGADPNAGAERFTPLIAAVLHRNELLVGRLLDHGADPNLPLGDFTPHQRGSTTDFFLHRSWVGASPLWLAARFSTPQIVGRLLQAGADPAFVHHGVYYGGGAGGNLSPRRDEVTTTLMAAVKMGAGRAWTVVPNDEAMVLESVTQLVEAGVDVNAVSSGVRLRRAPSRFPEPGHTALDGALALEYESVVMFLIASGADDGKAR